METKTKEEIYENVFESHFWSKSVDTRNRIQKEYKEKGIEDMVFEVAEQYADHQSTTLQSDNSKLLAENSELRERLAKSDELCSIYLADSDKYAKEVAELQTSLEAFKKALSELRKFIDDVKPSCTAGEDHLLYCKALTDKLLNPKQ